MEIVVHVGEEIGIVLTQDEYITLERILGSTNRRRTQERLKADYNDKGYDLSIKDISQLGVRLYHELSNYSEFAGFDSNGEHEWK